MIPPNDYLNKYYPMLKAASVGDLAAVQYMLSMDSVDADQADENGLTAFMAAAENGHVAVVKALIESKKINIKQTQTRENGRTALMAAAKSGHLDVITLLLEHGLSLNDKGAYGVGTVMTAAAEGGHLDVVTFLFKKNMSLDQPDDYGLTPLRAAAAGGHLAVVNFLFENGIKVDKPDNNGYTTLMAAAWGGHVAVVEFLLNNHISVNQVSVNQPDMYNQTPLVGAAWGGHLAVVEFFLKRDDINENQVNQSLIAAAEHGHSTVVEALFRSQKVTDVNQTVGSNTALILAAQNGNLDTVKALLNRTDIKVNQKNGSGDTALITAIKRGRGAVIALLLDRKDINVLETNSSGQRPREIVREFFGSESSIIEKMFLEKEAEQEKQEKLDKRLTAVGTMLTEIDAQDKLVFTRNIIDPKLMHQIVAFMDFQSEAEKEKTQKQAEKMKQEQESVLPPAERILGFIGELKQKIDEMSQSGEKIKAEEKEQIKAEIKKVMKGIQRDAENNGYIFQSDNYEEIEKAIDGFNANADIAAKLRHEWTRLKNEYNQSPTNKIIDFIEDKSKDLTRGQLSNEKQLQVLKAEIKEKMEDILEDIKIGQYSFPKKDKERIEQALQAFEKKVSEMENSLKDIKGPEYQDAGIASIFRAECEILMEASKPFLKPEPESKPPVIFHMPENVQPPSEKPESSPPSEDHKPPSSPSKKPS